MCGHKKSPRNKKKNKIIAKTVLSTDVSGLSEKKSQDAEIYESSEDKTRVVLWVQAVIAALTILVLIFQCTEFKSTDEKIGRQLAAMESQSEILKTQTDYLIDHDRPYIEPESVWVNGIQGSDNPEFQIKFKNSGGARANKVCTYVGVYMWLGDDFTIVADLKDSLLNGYEYGDVSPGGSFSMQVRSNYQKRFIDGIRNGTGVAYVFGKYRFSDWRNHTDTAKFCFYYNPYDKKFPFCSNKEGFRKSGMPFIKP